MTDTGPTMSRRRRTALLRTDRATIAAFMIGGSCAAITGILLASLLGSGTVSAGDGYLLDSFAAVFLGTPTFWQFVFKGGILVLAVALSTIARRYSRL